MHISRRKKAVAVVAAALLLLTTGRAEATNYACIQRFENRLPQPPLGPFGVPLLDLIPPETAIVNGRVDLFEVETQTLIATFCYNGFAGMVQQWSLCRAFRDELNEAVVTAILGGETGDGAAAGTRVQVRE